MEGIPDDMWSPFKHIHKIIERTLTFPNEVSVNDLETCLKKYKQSLSSILKNPPKNESHRAQLVSGIAEGISLPGQTRKILLSKDLVDECIILSDMFELDEFHALELLCTAQKQVAQHPGMPRGLIAVLLYYDGRRAITYSLRDLFQVSNGISWVTNVPKEISLLITSYTQSLVDDFDILGRIIDVLEDLDMSKEIMLLTKNRALGSRKHQNQIRNLYQDIRVGLATALFNWSAQRGLSKEHVCKLLDSFRKYKYTEGSGVIDDVLLHMLMALLFAFDTSVLLSEEDTNAAIKSIPLLSDNEFIGRVYGSLTNSAEAEAKYRFHSIVKFAFGLSLASLRQSPQNIQCVHARFIEKDEQLVDDALDGKVFECLYYYVLEQKSLYKNEFFYRRIHVMFTDFIEYMHSKVTEMRGKADDTAKTIASFMKEGLEPPANLDHNFEMLLLCIGKFYKDNRAGLSLCVEYWGPLDNASNYAKATSRSVSLFKFLRLAGELLPNSLFVPYLKMISGLTSCQRSARNAYSLLRQQSGLTGTNTLSWEHFFASLSRYYSYLRQEQCPASDTIYKARAFNRSISPQEIEGLHAVLEVIKAVTTYDEIARITICEHPNWAPLHILLGLLSCSVPLPLKADILETLASFALSKETAISLWTNLEASQIISTVPTLNTYNSCNLEMEINQNEARNETYPLSQGILDLLYALVTTAVPTNLGNTPRKTSLDPYINFVLNGIFLKFYNRTYKNSVEKWQVGEKCLRLFVYLLSSYEVTPDDFNAYTDNYSASPGFQVMLEMHTKSDMLRLILYIIDEARVRLDEYSVFPEKEAMERCAFHCLQLIEYGLAKQNVFFDAHSVSSSSQLLSGLNKLLLDINPRTRQPDYILNIAQFVTYGNWLPSHALVAIKILALVTRQPSGALPNLGIFTQPEQVQTDIRQGFVECLEGDLVAPTENSSVEDDGNVRLQFETKEAIIEFLQRGLGHKAPNIAHFLLGFDFVKDVPTDYFHKLNLIDSANHCLKSLVSLLDEHLEVKLGGYERNANVERIIERSYHLVYCLCVNQRTSDTVLRYLRSCNDFLYRHLSAFHLDSPAPDSHFALFQKCHLIRCAAIELRMASSHGHISRFQNLCALLVGTATMSAHQDNMPLELSHMQFHHLTNNMAEKLIRKSSAGHSTTFLLCHLLDCLEFETRLRDHPKWDFFDNALIDQVLGECATKAANGQKLICIPKVHEILNEELLTVQNSIAVGQRNLIQQEIESVIAYAVELNNQKNQNFATIKLIEAWGEICEVLFCCVPETCMAAQKKQELILEILQKILRKVVPIQPMLEISILTSGTVLLLLVNLRCITAQQQHGFSDSQLKSDSFASCSMIDSSMSTSKSNILSLKLIFKYILEWIIFSGLTSQKLRVNLYATLLNCLKIIKGYETSSPQKPENQFFVSCLDKTRDVASSEANPSRAFVDVLMACGDKLINIICHDCISGHQICKMAALSCIDSLLELDCMASFVNIIANRGYLAHVISSLVAYDEQLCRAFNTSVDFKALYVYESKMAMLIRIASSHFGAELLLTEKVLPVLSNMKVFDLHPDFPVASPMDGPRTNDFVPSLDARFRQILFPALNLCNCVISTLGSENRSATSQIMSFILAHSDMFEVVLRTGSPCMSLGLLEELALVTGLIARATNQEMFLLEERQSNPNTTAKLYRIQHLMVSLLSRFIVSDSMLRQLLKPENATYEPTEPNKMSHVKSVLEVAANLCLYCRNAVANHSVDHKANNVLFSANLSELYHSNDKNQNNVFKTYQSISLIVNELKGSVEYYNSQKYAVENILRQKKSLPNLSFEATGKWSTAQSVQQLGAKEIELSLCTFITDQCLYLLWTHLDFYMRTVNSASISRSNNFKEDAYAQELCGGLLVSPEELGHLKKTLISLLNETFCKQLLSTCELQTEMERGFVEALLRRMKALLQHFPVD